MMSEEGAVDESEIQQIESAKCECCGLTEDCTPAYILGIRERYSGKWICGLCSEAVNHEILRSTTTTTDEALARHLNVCTKFRSPPTDPTLHLITAVRHVIRRSLDSPRSAPVSPMRKPPALTRSGSCFPTMLT